MSIEVQEASKTVVDQQVHFTYVDYRDVPREQRIPINATSRKPPAVVTAGFIILEEDVLVALATTSPKDQFSRKVGREIVKERLKDHLLGQLSEEDEAKFIRKLPELAGEDLDKYAAMVVSGLGLRRDSAQALVISETIKTIEPRDQTPEYITECVRNYIISEFGYNKALPTFVYPGF